MILELSIFKIQMINYLYRLSKFTIMSTREGGRRIKVEVRGLPETRHMLMYISERMRRVGDLATKLKFVYEDIKKTDEIKIYRDKFHLPNNENINIIETGEEIIVYTKATETEYFEENEDNKETLLNVREKVLEEKEKNLEKRETEMRIKEEDIEALAKMKETELKEKIDDLEKRRAILKAKEELLEKRKKEFQLKEKDLRKKDEDFNLILKAREEKLEQKEKDVELKDESLDLKIQEKEKAFSELLTVKDELIRKIYFQKGEMDKQSDEQFASESQGKAKHLPATLNL